jgi:DMSO/TMAO reductase YedYZ molybdopterin-dependent catalytic subunit
VRTMRDRGRLLLRWMAPALALIVLALTGCTSVPRVDWTLNVTGDVGKPLALDYATLAQLPQTELKDIVMQKSMGEDEIHSWSGVSIDVILDEAEAGTFSGVTAVASDGYAVEISRDELEGAIVALKRDGEWITTAEADKGPIRLVTPETPANRWVFQITEIRVNE